MGARKYLSVSFSCLKQEEVEAFCMERGIGLRFNPVALGMSRVLHFEVLCRAAGYDPSLLLFRRFVHLAKNEWPSRVQPFLEPLLVLLGINKLWDKPNRDPVLMRSDQGMHFPCSAFLHSFEMFTYVMFLVNSAVMSTLDFVESDDTSDVVFTDAQATEGEDAVARGSEHRYEDVGYVSVPNVKGFTKTADPKALARRSSRRTLKSVAQSTSSDHVELSNDIEVSEGQGPDAEKEKNLVVLGKKKALGKKVAATPVQGSSSKDVKGLSEDEVYVPNWSVKIGDSFKDASVCADVLANFAPPVSEVLYQRWREYEEFSKKKEKMKASMAAMKKENDGFSKKEEAWVKTVGELTRMHEVEINDLKKSFEADKLKADRETLDVQKKAFAEEKEGLKVSVVVTYLLHSKEFKSALGDVYTKLLNYGKHLGLVAGFKLHKSGQALEQSPLFHPEASGFFKESVQQMERLTYPYVSEVSSCFGKPLSVLQELKPAGLNEMVCVEVLSSMSKKRSRSGDSEETFSENADISKEVSLEGSTVGGDGGPKAKKAKKAKKGKGDGSGASKPSAGV
ncbi:hypothetical protein Hanom_Chr16g01477411 [Helianthus anomalus]